MDYKDERILDVLKENSKLSTQQISKKTSIPITTVHHRIKKLEKNGVIKNYTVVLDNKKIGKSIAAYVLINVDYKLLKQIGKKQYDLAKKLKLHQAVEDASVITGETDTIIKVRVKNMDELNKLIEGYIRNLDGVDRTRTLVVLDEV